MRNVVILGMHRSGTSMVAEALSGGGIFVGEKSDLLVGQEDNPHGFWERTDVVTLDDELLDDSGGSWFRPPGQLLPVSAGRKQALDAILDKMPSAQSWLIKDPRMALTWRAWQEPLRDTVLVYVYRSPLPVATSLQRRNGFPLALGIALWEYYNRQALSIIEGREAICVSYEDIAGDPIPSLSRLLAELAARGVGCEAQVDEKLFDSSLGHSGREHSERARSLLTAGQLQLAQYCEQLCRGGSPGELPAQDPALLARIDDLADALEPLARVVETGLELEHMTALCEERTSERDHGLKQLNQLEGSYQSLVEAHEGEKKQHRELEGQYRSLESEHESLARAHRNQVDEYQDLAARHEELNEKADYLFDALSDSYRRLLEFEQSSMAGVSRFTGRLYKLLTFKRGRLSSYDNVLDDARQHFEQFELELPQKPPGRLELFGDVIRYAFQNPAGSARSFSFARLRRAMGVFLGAHPEDLDVWVKSRFPEAEDNGTLFDTSELDESLDAQELIFPEVEAPKVSIVIPVYNDYRVTKNCLRSILENTQDVSYEVIIADDLSDDLTATIEQRVANITVVRGEENLRFIGNCNRAARVARGQYVLILNNDTAVCAGWLSSLVEVADDDATVGIVGPKLLFANGRLQEAGGIMWRDASAWNFGRMDDPDKPDYNYLKEVDYISGACLLIRHDLWRKLGGFDTYFVPAYYEDADIAFAARAAGYRVIYQPAAQVFHYEGVSNGTELNAGVKQYQVQNQEKFREKWAQELDSFHFANAEHVFWARDRSRDRRSVLFIDHYVPHYDKDAGSRSTFMYVQLMLELGYKVLFLGANYFPHKPYTDKLRQMGVEVLVGEHMARNQDRWLQDNAPYIDRIYLHRPHVAEQFLGSLKKMYPCPPIIFFGHDLHYLRIDRESKVLGDESLRKTADKWRKREYAVFDEVDKIYYPSQVEVEEIEAHRPHVDARAIPLYVLGQSEEAPYDHRQARDILFVGGFNHPPNEDAVTWFVEEVLPLVREQNPQICLHVVGSNPTDAVQSLQGKGVTVYGYLTDEELHALYRRVRLAVVPLRFGAGVKGKVLEAIQQNVPLVTTSVGAEGIPRAEAVMVVADSAEEFAGAVLKVDAGDPEALARLDAYGDWLEQNFSRDRAAEIVLEDFGPPLRQAR